jgi:hypothetical protein
VSICFGQNNQLDKDTSKYQNAPLFVLRLSQLSSFPTSDIVINPADIDSVFVYKGASAEELYSGTAKNGVVEFVLKRGMKILNFNDLLTAYHISSAESSLPVFVDSAIIEKPKTTFFEPATMKYVKIETEKSTGMKYIDIRTIFPISRPNKDEIYIRGKAADFKLTN